MAYRTVFYAGVMFALLGFCVSAQPAGAQEDALSGIPQQVQGEDAERLIDSFLRGDLSPSAADPAGNPQTQLPELIFEIVALLADGSFEETKFGLPEGWTVEPPDAACAADTTRPALQGAAALRCEAGENRPVRACSPLMALDPEVVSVTAQVMSSSPTGRAELCFLDATGALLQAVPLRTFSGQGAWVRHRLNDTQIPQGANAVQLALESVETTWWDGAEVTANCEYKPHCSVLVNTLGYESVGPKIFMVMANFSAASPRFVLRDGDGREVWASPLGKPERVIGGGGFDWGAWFYAGDFSDFQDEGTFTLTVDLDGLTAEVPGITVEFDRYWKTLFPACVQGLAELGSGAEADRFWPDPSGKQEDQSLYFFNLASNYRSLIWRMRRPDAPEIFSRECARCASTASQILQKASALPEGSPPDDALARVAAGLLILSRYHPDVKADVALFKPLIDHIRAHPAPSPWWFSLVWNYRQSTSDVSVNDLLNLLNPGIRLEILDDLLEAEGESALTDASVTVEIGSAANGVAALLLKRSSGAFSLYQAVEKPAPRFFAVPASAGAPCGGNSAAVLQAAEYMARSYRFAARPEYLRFIHAQMDWVLGRNPLNLCVVTGVAGPNGPLQAEASVPVPAGIVLEGISARGPADDRPWFPDASSVSEATNRAPSLSATFHLFNTLSHLKRIRIQMPDEKKR